MWHVSIPSEPMSRGHGGVAGVIASQAMFINVLTPHSLCAGSLQLRIGL